jgi:hypothetical protein
MQQIAQGASPSFNISTEKFLLQLPNSLEMLSYNVVWSSAIHALMYCSIAHLDHLYQLLYWYTSNMYIFVITYVVTQEEKFGVVLFKVSPKATHVKRETEINTYEQIQ